MKNITLEGSFARNFTITLSANTVAILIGFAFTPFIARVYSPDAYGFFAFFISVTQNVALISTLQFPRAFVLPESEQEFHNLLNAAIMSLVVTIVLATLALALFGDSILASFELQASQIGLLTIVIPFAILLYALNDIFKSWNIRKKSFTRNAVTQVISSSASRSSTLVYGIVTSGNVWGLLVGDLVSKILENVFLAFSIATRSISKVFDFDRRRIFGTVRAYRGYPLFILPGIWMQSLITQLPIYTAMLFFDSESAGYYSFANSLLNLPANILAGAMAPVFLQKASETLRRNPQDLARIVRSLADRLFFTALVPIVLLMVFGDYIFTFVLGDQWSSSGSMASYMGLYFLFLILNYPLVAIYRILEKERLSLLTTLLGLLLAVLALAVGTVYGDFMVCIALFSAASVIYYLINIYLILALSGIRPFSVILRWIICFVLVFMIILSIRKLIAYFWL